VELVPITTMVNLRIKSEGNKEGTEARSSCFKINDRSQPQ
jgi:hypothetical protein